jgi:tetratricopeptide (TPR) repeat protein
MAEHGKEPQAETDETLEQPNPTAVAVALGAARAGAKLPDEAADFLKKQGRLTDLQTEHLHEQRLLQLAHLRVRRWKDRLSLALQSLGILAGAFVVAIVAGMVWQAHEDHGLVIEAFSVPPDLARDGLTGQVVAARFLDKLQAMQTTTESERPADSYQNNWGSEIKVEIPQTGLNFSDFERLLRARLGHVVHLTGEVFRTPAGIAITARLGDEPPQTFTGPQSDIDTLAQKAAEAVYRTSQPYRYAEFLAQHGRGPEAFSVLADLAANGPLSERGWAYTQWGLNDLNLNGDVASARKHLLQGLAFADVGMMSAGAILNVENWAGHEEKVLEYARLTAARLKTNRQKYTRDALDNVKFAADGVIAHELGDYAEAVKQFSAGGRMPDFYGSARADPAMAATDLALDHDPAAARSAIAMLEPNDDVSLLQAIADFSVYALPAYAMAAATDNWAGALADARTVDSWLEARKSVKKILGPVQQVWIHPLEALAMAKTGDVAGAQTLIATTPADCYLCVRVRGEIATVKQDWPAAERWFAEAARQAPSIPFAFSEWGEMRLAKGDLAGAIAKFDLAHQKGPRFADPLELWGEALMRQGDYSGAVRKFHEADKYAPRWGRNHLRWGQALAAQGKRADAHAQFTAARGMDLSAADRSALAKLD